VQLTRPRVVAAAMDLIERDGAAALSMSALATELGCGLVALYSLVPSRAALLDAVADTVVAGIQLEPAPAGSWEEHLTALASGIRDAAAARPQCAVLAATRPARSAARLRLADRALAMLSDAGFGSLERAAIMRAVGAYILGAALLDAGARTDEDEPAARCRLTEPEFSAVKGSFTVLNLLDTDTCFRLGLDLLVRGAAALAPRADGDHRQRGQQQVHPG
jgi:AcrR family transcriptional regulator